MVLDAKALLEQSRGMSGALGAIAYTVLKGLEAGGAEAKLVAGTKVLMQEHFSRLSDADCNALCDNLVQRLRELERPGQPWYGGPAKPRA